MINKALRALSMIIRKIPTKDNNEKLQNLDQSIDFAKRAVACDFKDSESWYVLGNAHLTNFFGGSKAYEHLNFALKAYTQAEKSQVYENPDLYYNRATIYNYLENYSEAMGDYQVSHSIDPSLGAKDRERAIEDFVIRVWTLIQNKGTVKSKSLKSLVKSIPKSIGQLKFIKQEHKSKVDKNSIEETKDETENDQDSIAKYKVLTTETCVVGDNSAGVFVCKLVCPLKKDQQVPVWFLVVDSEFRFSVLSVYNISNNIENFKFGDLIMVRDPNYKIISIKYKKDVLSYPSIMVTDICNVLVNKEPMSDEIYNPELVTRTFN